MSIVPTTPQRNRDLKRIHSQARDLGLSEFAYRATLVAVTGRDSALEMTPGERQAVLSELEAEAAARRPHVPVTCSDAEALAILG